MKHYQYLVEEESIGLQCFQRKLIPNFILSDIIGGKILWKLYLFCCKRKDIGCQNQSLCPSGEIDIIAIKYWTVSPLRMRAPEKEWTFYKVGRMYCKYWTVWPLRMQCVHGVKNALLIRLVGCTVIIGLSGHCAIACVQGKKMSIG